MEAQRGQITAQGYNKLMVDQKIHFLSLVFLTIIYFRYSFIERINRAYLPGIEFHSIKMDFQKIQPQVRVSLMSTLDWLFFKSSLYFFSRKSGSLNTYFSVFFFFLWLLLYLKDGVVSLKQKSGTTLSTCLKC